MEKLKNVWLLLLLLVGMAACSDDDDNVQVTLSTREVKLEVTGGTTSFTVQTVGDWTIETDGQSWYTVSPQQGTGTTEVTVTAEASGEVASRSANLVVRSGSALATLVVTQIGTENPADPSNQTIKVRAKGGDREIVLPANEGYEVTIPTDADWVKLKEKKSGSVVLTLAANEAGDHYRTVAVTVSKTDGSHLATLNLSQSWRNVEPGELLFQEVFLTSNLIAETGKTDSRNMEQYFILTNNTDEELEIGGVAFAESAITTLSTTMTNQKWEPDNRDNVAAIQSLYVIPKDRGKNTLAARESVLIVNNAQNYKATNATSFDLTGADFEWYNESTVSSMMDVDNPDVPNMDVWISNSMTIYILNVQMNHGFVLVSLPADLTAATFVDNDAYLWSGTRSWQVASTGRDFSTKFNYQAVPNDWGIDAVVIGTKEGFAYNPFGSALDAGFTYCAVNSDDTSRYGKAVRRKANTDGTLVDTNNSTNDFEPAVAASLAK